VFCLPSIQAGGGAVRNLISQRKSGIPPQTPLPLFLFSNGTGTASTSEQKGRMSGGGNFARLLGGVYLAE